MEMAHAVIKGKSNKEIMFSSYVCHPSMANNELSGPVLTLEILDYLKKNFKTIIIPTGFYSPLKQLVL